MWMGLFLAVLAVNAAFDHSIMGIRARPVFLALLALAGTYVAFVQVTYEAPDKKLIRTHHIAVTQERGKDDGTYGYTDTEYYIIYPALYYHIPRNNQCPGFSASDRSTWCGDAAIFPTCTDPAESCMITKEQIRAMVDRKARERQR